MSGRIRVAAAAGQPFSKREHGIQDLLGRWGVGYHCYRFLQGEWTLITQG